MQIHSTAVVAETARVGAGTTVGPFVVIEDDVEIGRDNRLLAHCVIKRGVRIGDGNTIHEHAVIGGLPQDLGFTERPSFVRIGDRNTLREYVTVHRATREGEATTIANDTYLMATAHVAHDCRLESRVIMANGATLAGFAQVGERAFLSGGVMVHQFARVGRCAMIGGNSKITQDCLPFFITDGVPAHARGINLVGLRRAGYGAEDIRALKQAYRLLLRSGTPLESALASLAQSDVAAVRELHAFLLDSRRGFHHAEGT
ncbi:acyl-ACP--UDP-N-acetylglucosamine O-acyltransferase [Ectothiorhodospiraceae bacterium 2226]|nr:acyl-ACP--UDP-N-acetylglucosamine O-acyltransferase [Ectothiorhodospiraceae bacterium 2226]